MDCLPPHPCPGSPSCRGARPLHLRPTCVLRAERAPSAGDVAVLQPGDPGRSDSTFPQVIQRIFYTVNRSWSGRITCAELRRSTFLQVGRRGGGAS